MHAIMPELGEVVEYEKLTDKFVGTLKDIVEEMQAELERVDTYKAGLEAQATGPGNPCPATGTGTLGESQASTKRGGGSAASTSKSGTKNGKHTVARGLEYVHRPDPGQGVEPSAWHSVLR